MFKDFNFTSYKFLAATAAFFALAGMINTFYPASLLVKSISNKVRLHDASGDIVIISIDDYADKHGISAPIPASHARHLFQSLLDADVEKIVLSVPVSIGSPEETKNLKELLDSYADKVFIAQPEQSRQNAGNLMWQDYVSSPVDVHVKMEKMFWGGAETIKYAQSVNGRPVIAAQAAISESYGTIDESFHIDYAIDINSLTYTSYNDETLPNMAEVIKGKKIILGYETSHKTNSFRILGHDGRFGLPTVIALGAETLQQGNPATLSGIWSFAIALLFCWYILGSRRLNWQIGASVTALISIFGLTVLLNNMNISLRTEDALCLLLFVTPFALFKSSRSKVIRQSATHLDSGLPSVNALRLQSKTENPLIVCRMDKFDELMGLLSSEQRIMLAERISSLATTQSDIWHGDDGHFYWFIDETQASNLDGHIESLSVIMRNGFSIGHFPISMQTVFGVDLRYDQKMSDRIMAANLAAKQATSKGEVWRTYEATDQSEAAWEITQLHELDIAIRTDQIVAHLQPKVSLQTGATTGAEALARWTHPIRGSIRPDEFVATAEAGGRIKELTIAVMRSALTAVQPAIIADPEFKVAINITPSLLTDRTLCHTISSLLAQYQIQPSNLILEVTESTAFSDNQTCFQTMHELVSMGITLSIDDYGTGNSTLDYLRKIPARELKIDREFVSDILTSEEDSALVHSTIRLAHKLKMKVVAEGVEDSPTLEKLRIMGCDQVQGYLISHPLSAEDFLLFISNIIATNKIVNK